jgi:hypothetical protein
VAITKFRVGIAIVVAVGALTLTGCAGNPDLADLEANLSKIDGVNGAMAYTTHSGAPWNTQVVVMLFLDEPTDEGIVASTRAAAPVLADDPTASRHEVSIAFIDGDRADYDSQSEAYRDDLTIMPAVVDALGLPDTGSSFVTLSPDDVRRLADGS